MARLTTRSCKDPFAGAQAMRERLLAGAVTEEGILVGAA
jgi:hypothetical protein